MEKKDSIFASLNPAPPPGARAPAPERPMAAMGPDPRIAGLEAAVKALQSEIASLKQAAAKPPPPVLKSEADQASLKGVVEVLKARIEEFGRLAATKGDLAAASFKAEGANSALEASLGVLRTEADTLKQAVFKPPRPDAETIERLARAEADQASFKGIVETLSARVEALSRSAATKGELASANFRTEDTLSALEAERRRLSGYAEGFDAIEKECRKSLGEMRGCLRNLGQKMTGERLDAQLKETVARLGDRLAELETEMHAGLNDLAGRMMSDKIVHDKMLADAEDRLRKILEPDASALSGKLKNLADKIIWLTDEYNIVMERKLRALEAKYSAFDALAARLDSLEDEAAPEREGKGGERR